MVSAKSALLSSLFRQGLQKNKNQTCAGQVQQHRGNCVAAVEIEFPAHRFTFYRFNDLKESNACQKQRQAPSENGPSSATSMR
jgi:hypothetical protein